MQPTKSRQRNDLVSAPRSRGRNATVGCVLPQSEMSAIFVVIADVVFQQSFQVPLVQNDDVIKQISSHTPNPALGETILPRTAECRADGFSSVVLDGRNNVSGKFRVAVKYQESVGLVVSPNFSQLQCDPQGVGLTAHIAVQNLPPVMADDEEDVQHAERQRRHGEKVHGSDGVAVIPQECQPTLGRIWSSRDLSKPS